MQSNAIATLIMSPGSTAGDFLKLRGSQINIGEAESLRRGVYAATMRQRDEVIQKGLELGVLAKGDAFNPEGLYKSENIGTQLQGQAFTSTTTADSELAPLVPQSFDGELKDLTADPDSCCMLTNDLYKQPVQGLVREAVVETDAMTRPFASGFITEGSEAAGSNDRAAYARRVVTVRFEAQRDSVSDVAMLVQAATPTGFVPRSLYDTVRRAAMKRLAYVRERNIWWGDNACDANAYDGYFKTLTGLTQDTATGRVTMASVDVTSSDVNLAGQVMTGKFIRDFIDNKYSPTVGRQSIIRKVYAHPLALNALKDEAESNTRYDGQRIDKRNPLRFFADRLTVSVAHQQDVELIAHPGLGGVFKRNTNTSSGGTSAPVIVVATNTNAASANSLFTAADAGAYIYRITALNATGESAPVNSGAVTVAAGDSVTIDVTVSSGTPLWYAVERSKVNGLVGTSQLIGYWKTNTAGAGGKMRIVDDNLTMPYTSPILFTTGMASDVQWESLLPAYVKPLAQTGTTAPFLVLDFGSLFIINPEKLGIALNAGYTS